jgi:phosphatidylglycerol:prolipoprotein diacylglycerol transferase
MNMFPILFKIGPVTFYSYGLMVALGFLAGIFVALRFAKKEKIQADAMLDISFYTLIFGLIGARIFYIISDYSYFLKNPLEAFMFWKGGMVFWGGVLFGITALVSVSLIKKLSVLRVLDIASLSTMIGYSIGRIGCFLRGCCYGEVCGLPWAVKFPDLYGLRHPTQIYASLSGLAIFLLLVSFWKRKKFSGQIFCLALILYSIYRFLIEFIRVNPRVIFGLSQAQVISIVIFPVAVSLYGILYFKSRVRK